MLASREQPLAISRLTELAACSGYCSGYAAAPPIAPPVAAPPVAAPPPDPRAALTLARLLQRLKLVDKPFYVKVAKVKS